MPAVSTALRTMLFPPVHALPVPMPLPQSVNINYEPRGEAEDITSQGDIAMSSFLILGSLWNEV